MKSIKNHISLVVALVSVLLSIQVLTIIDRSVAAYQEKLLKNYSLVVVSKEHVNAEYFLDVSDLILDVSEIKPDDTISGVKKLVSIDDVNLLKSILPKFYKIYLNSYPNSRQISSLKENILSNNLILKVETFSKNHSSVYKFLLLFKNVIMVFSILIFIVTSLLVFKELSIWRFKHNERMTIMGLFGAPVWMRSAILYRLSIVDAIISSLTASLFFIYLSSSSWVLEQYANIGIDVIIFDVVNDTLFLISIAISLSVLLATFIVLGHKEEV